MANMQYCRFSNTLEDLRECIDVIDGIESPITSTRERNCAVTLIEMMCEFVINNNLISYDSEDYATIDKDEIISLVEHVMSEEEE